MGLFRELRHAVDLSQQQFATRLGVSEESCRAWDSGRRPVPVGVIRAAEHLVVTHRAENEWLPLQGLAREFNVSVFTLRSAVRTGRLEARFEVRSVFGRPCRRATRAACRAYLADGYGRRVSSSQLMAPLIAVPRDYHVRLRTLRRRLGLSQSALARQIGAAGKAVVYQWESRKRTPSPVLWVKIERLHLPASRKPG